MMQEASIAFASHLDDAALRHFRESHRGVGDISMAFLTTHMRIERWREALLWSWTVAKIGGADGKWGEEAREQLKRLLGVEDLAQSESVKIRRAPRDTLSNVASNFERVAWEAPMATDFRFCEQMCGTNEAMRDLLYLRSRSQPRWMVISRALQTFGFSMMMWMHAKSSWTTVLGPVSCKGRM